MSRIKSLGIGSQVLTGDIIDKLKAADEAGQIRPLQQKIQENTTKQRDVTAITTILGTLKVHASALGQDTTYLKRRADINGKSVGVEVTSGVNIHNFNIDVKQLAQSDVYQSKKFSSPNDIISKGANSFKNGSFNVSVGDKKFKIDVDSTMTYEELANQINTKSKGELNAKILNVGDGEYQLILQSKESGTKNKIKFEPLNSATDPKGENADKILQSLGWGKITSQETGRFSSTNSKKLFRENGSFELSVGNKKYTINVNTDTTLEDLAKQINTETNGAVNAEIVKSGDKYQLVLKSNEGDVKFEPLISAADPSAKTKSEKILKSLIWGNKSFYETKEFNSANDKNIFKKGSFELSVGNKKYTINVNEDTTLESLATEISAKTGGKVGATIEKTNDGKFKLNVISAEGEVKFEPSKSSSDPNIEKNSKENLQKLGFAEKLDLHRIEKNDGQIQKAQDAEFTYNGVKMTRSGNKFNDITVGVNITLKETGKTNVDIVNDTKNIANEIEEFVKAYNNLVNNLKVATDYNEKTNVAGTLQGINEISTIKSTLNKTLLKTEFMGKFVEEEIENKDSKKTSKISVLTPTSMADFGLTLNKSGLLEFDRSVLEKKVDKDFESVKKFFLGDVTHSKMTYSSKPISGGKINIGSGALKINEKEIMFNTNVSNTAEQNAIELMNAINKANIKGLKVSINKSKDGIILNKDDGGVIEITGRDSDLKQLGLEKTTIRSQSTENKGTFARLTDDLIGMLGKVGKEGSIEGLSKSLINENKKLTKEKEDTQAWINERYAMMEEQFARFDSVIGKLNRQFSALQSMINAELNKK